MTQFYLSRTVDSIIKDDVPRGDESRLREQIRQNAGELADETRIADVLSLGALDHGQRILVEAILNSLLIMPEMAASEDMLFNAVKRFESTIIAEAQSEEAFSYSDRHSLEIYSAVLEVALEDGQITQDEAALLERLRHKIGVTHHEHQLLEAKLRMFPKPTNELHTLAEFREALKRLQVMGVLLFCNRAEGGSKTVLPEEIASAVKRALGFEMSPEAQELLHKLLSTGQLYQALQAQGLPVSGNKAERSERLLKAGVKPSEILGVLKIGELEELCRRLPGVPVYGSKADKTARIIGYFDSLVAKEPEESDDPRAVFYQYFEEFAKRDNKNLYQRKLIRHDRDMETGFEEGTRYLFEVKLEQPLVEMTGVEHADGCVAFPNGELLLWDNKGKESIYRFPKAHHDQFRRYIRASTQRVNVFLVVVPGYAPEARLQAMRLKNASQTDTDVALISAEDLKYVAEKWRKFASKGEFSLEVFNTTGLLDRASLDERMAVLLE